MDDRIKFIYGDTDMPSDKLDRTDAIIKVFKYHPLQTFAQELREMSWKDRVELSDYAKAALLGKKYINFDHWSTYTNEDFDF